jgi:hypothetical protein
VSSGAVRFTGLFYIRGRPRPQVQVQVQLCFTSVGGQVQPLDVALAGVSRGTPDSETKSLGAFVTQSCQHRSCTVRPQGRCFEIRAWRHTVAPSIRIRENIKPDRRYRSCLSVTGAPLGGGHGAGRRAAPLRCSAGGRRRLNSGYQRRCHTSPHCPHPGRRPSSIVRYVKGPPMRDSCVNPWALLTSC